MILLDRRLVWCDRYGIAWQAACVKWPLRYCLTGGLYEVTAMILLDRRLVWSDRHDILLDRRLVWSDSYDIAWQAACMKWPIWYIAWQAACMKWPLRYCLTGGFYEVTATILLDRRLVWSDSYDIVWQAVCMKWPLWYIAWQAACMKWPLWCCLTGGLYQVTVMILFDRRLVGNDRYDIAWQAACMKWPWRQKVKKTPKPALQNLLTSPVSASLTQFD